MSFMERWGESVDPGNTGNVDISAQHETCRCLPLVAARFVAVVIGLPVAWYKIIPHVPLPLFQAIALVIGGTLVYVALAYLINPQPDIENLGWAGGLIDHPWRYSDDINRTLLTAQCFLGPGRFIAESLLDVRELFKERQEAGVRDERLETRG
ncbi:MAG: hypothetical protein V3V75_07465 [Thermoguttaceae bacterium]